MHLILRRSGASRASRRTRASTLAASGPTLGLNVDGPCPRCGAPRSDGPECLRCGVIFAKLEAHAAAVDVVPSALVDEPYGRPDYLPAETPAWSGELDDARLEYRL